MCALLSERYCHNWVYQLTPMWAMVGSLTPTKHTRTHLYIVYICIYIPHLYIGRVRMHSRLWYEHNAVKNLSFFCGFRRILIELQWVSLANKDSSQLPWEQFLEYENVCWLWPLINTLLSLKTSLCNQVRILSQLCQSRTLICSFNFVTFIHQWINLRMQ